MDGDEEAATRYRQRAEELRVIAASIEEEATRILLKGVAEDYERMAKTLDGIAESERARAAKPE